LPEPDRPNLRHHLQSRAPLVLAAAYAARGGAGVQSLRFGEGRPRPLVRPHRVRRPDLAAQRAAAREHRNPHAGVFLKPSTIDAPPGELARWRGGCSRAPRVVCAAPTHVLGIPVGLLLSPHQTTTIGRTQGASSEAHCKSAMKKQWKFAFYASRYHPSELHQEESVENEMAKKART